MTTSVRGFHRIRPYRADLIAGRIIAALYNPTPPRYPRVISYSFASLLLSPHASVLRVHLQQRSKFSPVIIHFSLFVFFLEIFLIRFELCLNSARNILFEI